MHPIDHNLVGGRWLPAASGKTCLNVNPTDHSDVVGEFPSSGAEDVNRAVEAAKEAYRTWRLVPAPRRAEILARTGNLLVQNKEKYARDMTREMGKVLAETRGDVQEAIDEAFYVAGEGRRLFGVTTPSELDLEAGITYINAPTIGAEVHLPFGGVKHTGNVDFGQRRSRCPAAPARSSRHRPSSRPSTSPAQAAAELQTLFLELSMLVPNTEPQNPRPHPPKR